MNKITIYAFGENLKSIGPHLLSPQATCALIFFQIHPVMCTTVTLSYERIGNHMRKILAPEFEQHIEPPPIKRNANLSKNPTGLEYVIEVFIC